LVDLCKTLSDGISALGASVLQNLITHPFDMIKTRMQGNSRVYSNLYNSTLTIRRKEGLRGFYKGLPIQMMLNVTQDSWVLTMFGYAKRFLTTNRQKERKRLAYFVGGCFTGFTTTFFTTPLEFIKCNQQMSTKKPTSDDVFYRKAYQIAKANGPLALYRGYWATFNRDVLPLGVYFYTYYSLKDFYIKRHGKFESTVTALAGGVAGLATWVTGYPFDTAKTIIQTSPLNKNALTQKRVLRELVRENYSLLGLYRGATPSLMLSVLGCSSMFYFFEMFQKIMRPFTKKNNM